jgi:hypothetical protein
MGDKKAAMKEYDLLISLDRIKADELLNEIHSQK